MKRLSVGALLLSTALNLSAAECVKVKDKEFQLANNDIGSAVVVWRADLTNECRKTLDADLTIQLLDEQNEPVYELMDKATLGVEEVVEVQKEVYVPSRIVDQVEDFRIQILERERLQ